MMTSEIDQEATPLVIPIFIMNRGCREQCIFCNQQIAAGNFSPEISQRFFDAEVASYLGWNKDRRRPVEIAFYGGSFTGLPPDDQNRLLSWADSYLQKGRVQSVRISTRPDFIEEDRLTFLQAHGVRTVEIGAQSMNDEVLRHARRGHDAGAVIESVQWLKTRGFRTGLHLMAGLPCETEESFRQGLLAVRALRPDTVRIHPTLVLENTPLADAYRAGSYQPLSLDDAVKWCRLAWETLAPAGIRIIRFGLQMTPEMGNEGAVLAGPLHPSFGSLVYSAIYFRASMQMLRNVPRHHRTLRFQIASRDESHFRGVGNRNMAAIKKLYPEAQIVVDSLREVIPGHLSLATGTGESFSIDIPGIV